MTDLEGDSETRERFYREAKIAGQLQHRNLISVYDMGEDEGRLFMVMELLKGDTLNDYLKRAQPLTLETCLDMMGQMCEGLAVAHVHRIFHRDIKPGNIFIQNDGSLKILDFGVARLADSNMTASGFIVGTPDFMSPEQARGREIDHRSDIFSTGAVFYYMLSGRKPFAAADLPAVLHKVEAEDPVPLTEQEAPPGSGSIISQGARQERDAPLPGARRAARRPHALPAGLRPRVARDGARRAQAGRGTAAVIEQRTPAEPARVCATTSSAWRCASGTRCSRTAGPRRSASCRSAGRRSAKSSRKSSPACSPAASRPMSRASAGQAQGWGREPKLVIDDGRAQRELLVVGTMVVGRDPECEISSSDPRLSRRHAEFRATPSGVVVRDLGSRNGVRVNNTPTPRRCWRPATSSQVAHLSLRFVDEAAVTPPRGRPRAPAAAIGRDRAGRGRSHARAPEGRVAADRGPLPAMPVEVSAERRRRSHARAAAGGPGARLAADRFDGRVPWPRTSARS